MLLLALLATTPFLLTTIPPLTDVPGHIGRFSVQTAPAGDGLFRYFGFHWTLTLNLASDLIVQALGPRFGVIPTMRLLCAVTPGLTVLGILSVARMLNPRGAHALPWALLFVYNYAFLWGFLNFALMAALALVAFAAWIALRGRPPLRAATFLAVTPLLLVGHGVAGIVMIGMIVGHAIREDLPVLPTRWSREHLHGLLRSLARVWPPIAATVVTVAVWKASSPVPGGATQWILHRKWDTVFFMLRDQSPILDTGSVLACVAIWMLGRRWGARLYGGAAGAVLAVIVLFLATPSLISGSDQIETRLAPIVAMLALALQDWSSVDPRRRRAVLLAGFALLAVRLGVTAVSFERYDERYRTELAALDHVPTGARILNLARVDCGVRGWRSQRLEHLGNLATTVRGAWVNAHWSIDGLQLLDVRYRPSPAYFKDPSQLIWPAQCVDLAQPFDTRDRHMLIESMPRLPLERVDYLWLIGERLPAEYHDGRLHRIWHDDMSELYAVHPQRLRPAVARSR